MRLRIRADFLFGFIFVFIIALGIVYPYISSFNPSSPLFKLVVGIGSTLVASVIIIMALMTFEVVQL